ncbi:MAG TPA: O-unit flippase-like protein [Paludibacter sp.]|nr:O-unit flippase-like protein [Paludibacter sp.]
MSGINIGYKDVVWNYLATFLQLGTGVLLMPFVLHYFPSETFSVWTIFSTVIALTVLLDLGFNQSFARNISYVVSGAKGLKQSGFHVVDSNILDIDYSLLKGIIETMRWFYRRMAFLLLVLLMTIGSFYIYRIALSYKGDKMEIYISWVILCLINSYSLYTFYYDSLMQGKGMVKRVKQIQIAGQTVYLLVAIGLIVLKFNLIAVVSAQVLSIVVKRTLSYYSVYTTEFKSKISVEPKYTKHEILKSIYPNAIKLGLVNIGNAIVTRSTIIIGALYLTLDQMAMYGITIQVIWVVASVGTVYFSTFVPKIIQHRAQNNTSRIINIYIYSTVFLVFTFVFGVLGLTLLGSKLLILIGSKTQILPNSYIIVLAVVILLDYNRGMAEWVLSTKNEIPFFKVSLFTSGIMLVLLIFFLKFTSLGMWSLVLAPAIAQNCYQNWKWPLVVFKELKINFPCVSKSMYLAIHQIKRLHL